MKKLFILLMLFIYTSLMAQIGISFKNGILNTKFKSFSFMSSKSREITTYTSELDLNYSIYKNIYINSGIGYNNIGYYSHEKTYDDNKPNVKISENYYYIVIPIFFSYKYNINKIYFGTDIGLQFNLKANAKQKSIFNREFGYTDGLNEEANKLVLYTIIGIKIGYNLTKDISIDITSRYNNALQYPLTNKNRPGLNTTSILAGINYNF